MAKGEDDCWLAWKLFKCFSIRHSYINLTNYTSPVVSNPGFYLIKIIYFFFIVLGHRMFADALAFSTSQSELLEKTGASDFVQLMNMDTIDVFFMLTGFLTFHLGYTPMKNLGSTYMFMSIGIRWLKLMPVYALLLLFVTQIFPYIGEGPWWKYRILQEVENCRDTWWTQLIALSNIINSKQQCLMISWYLSAEIQLAIVGSIILLVASKNTKFGFLAIGLTLFFFTEWAGIIAYKRRYQGTIFANNMQSLDKIRNQEQFYKYHIVGVTRIAPYLIGFTAAFIAKLLKDMDYKFSNKQKILIIASTHAIGWLVLYYGFTFYSHIRHHGPLENAIYAAIHRPIYVLPLATILCIYFTSGLGYFNHLFEMKIFIPFGRLVYSAFLVHCVVQLYHVSSQRGLLLIPKTLNLSYAVISDIVYSFIVGFLLFIFAAGPFHSITHLLHPQLVGTRRKSIQPLQEYTTRKRGVPNHAYRNDESTTC